ARGCGSYGRLGAWRYVHHRCGLVVLVADVREEQQVSLTGKIEGQGLLRYRGQVQAGDIDFPALPGNTGGQLGQAAGVTDHDVVRADSRRIDHVQVYGRLHAPHDAGDGVVGDAVFTGESPELVCV